LPEPRFGAVSGLLLRPTEHFRDVAARGPAPSWMPGFGLARMTQKAPKVPALGALHKETFRPPHREWILLRSAGFNKPIRVYDLQGLRMVSALEAHCLIVAAVDMNHLARI
jgi:hypothetical protein